MPYFNRESKSFQSAFNPLILLFPIPLDEVDMKVVVSFDALGTPLNASNAE
jgi:hypothetical protein